jgi:hypothetical protein
MATRRLPRNTQLVFPDDLELFNVAIERDAEGKESAQFTLNQWTAENLDAVIQFLRWIMPSAGLRTLQVSATATEHPDAAGAIPAAQPSADEPAVHAGESAAAAVHRGESAGGAVEEREGDQQL